MHVVLGVAGPRARPLPARVREGAHRAPADHPRPLTAAVAIGLGRLVVALAAADVRVLARVDVDRQPVGVVGPRAGPLAARARRGHRLSALERGRDVVGALALGAVEVLEAHVADREAVRVHGPERAAERAGRRLVDDQLTLVRLAVEAEVADGQQAQVAEADRAALLPEPALLELGLHRLRD